MQSGFFFSPEDDTELEATNSVFWDSLLGHIHEDCRGEPPRSLLDIGCHYGGLLSRLIAAWKPQRAWGVEPLAPARERSIARLQRHAPDVRILDTTDWPSIPASSFELITCHEVLYLVPDLTAFMANVHRALSPSGRVYLVLGCHAENPMWQGWKPQLEALGHRVYDHRPMDILAAGAALGFTPSIRPLRQSGWITHNPLQGEFAFPSAAAMLDHHFKYKLLFRFAQS